MTVEQIAASLETNREFFNRSTRALTEANSSFAPTPEQYPVAAMVAHAAQTIEWFLKGAFAEKGFEMNFEQMDKEVRACTSIEAARTWFNAATERGKAAAASHTAEEWAEPLPPGPIMGGQPRYAILSALTDHTAHHRGALSVYARLLGLVPPMPYMEM